MAALAGPIEQVSIDGRIFPVAADQGAERKLGGFEVEVEPNGDGSVRVIKARVPWRMDGLALSIDDVRGDQEFLVDIVAAGVSVPMTFTFASGLTYEGSGLPVGEIKFASDKSTAPVSFSGGRSLERQ